MDDFRIYYGPTMNAFDAAEQNGRAAELQEELEALFKRRNGSADEGATSIPANFLRVTAWCLKSASLASVADASSSNSGQRCVRNPPSRR